MFPVKVKVESNLAQFSLFVNIWTYQCTDISEITVYFRAKRENVVLADDTRYRGDYGETECSKTLLLSDEFLLACREKKLFQSFLFFSYVVLFEIGLLLDFSGSCSIYFLRAFFYVVNLALLSLYRPFGLSTE